MSRQPHVARGRRGAVAAAHPAAVDAALAMFDEGGNAVDAALAAQAVLCVVAPEACGLGGDALVLIAGPGHALRAINGTGAAPIRRPDLDTPGGTVTVPGIVGAWAAMAMAAARPLDAALAPAADLARGGVPVAASTVTAAEAQRERLHTGGAGAWTLLGLDDGDRWDQPALADALDAIRADGVRAFYGGTLAAAIAVAAQRSGGTLTAADLAAHRTPAPPPLEVPWDGGSLVVQPPMSQGVLLAMAASWFERAGRPEAALDHLGVEVVTAAFAYRDRVAEGAVLLAAALDVDPERATRRGGPRGYLHTAGVATADAQGTVVSSLVSVFDDFGSGVFVPEGGFVLNNRAQGFGAEPNALGLGVRPVHTLAPALLRTPDGRATALATPGADGQIQTLLQVLSARRYDGDDVAAALARPRWRAEDGRLLIEEGHPATGDLAARGHDVVPMPALDPVFGAMVMAGIDDEGPWACGDPRREVAVGGN